jgi:MFS family permease
VSSPGLLIAARFVKGAAAAFTAPSGMSPHTTTSPEGPMRNRAFSVHTVFGASGFWLGLVLSGLLTEISWRWTLLVPARRGGRSCPGAGVRPRTAGPRDPLAVRCYRPARACRKRAPPAPKAQPASGPISRTARYPAAKALLPAT